MENNQTIEERQDREKILLVDTLKEMPIIQIACKKAGISRATYYRWQQDDKDFKRKSVDAMNQGIEYINDMSESQVINLIKDGNMHAINLWLKNNHKRYGSKGREYTPIPTSEDLTPEEEKIMIEALAMASGKSYGNKNRRTISGKNL